MDEQPWTEADDERVIAQHERDKRRAQDICDTAKDALFVLSALAVGYWFLWTLSAVMGSR